MNPPLDTLGNVSEENQFLASTDGKKTYSDHNVVTMKVNWLTLKRQLPVREQKILTENGEHKSRLDMEKSEVAKITDHKPLGE